MDHEGRLWFGAEGRPGRPPAVCRWDGEKLELVYLTDTTKEQGQSINRVVVDARGNLWCGGYGLYCYDGKQFHCIEDYPGCLGQITFLLTRKDGILWVAADNGLYAYESGILKPIQQISSGNWFESLLEDPLGIIWISTYDGRLLCYNEDEFNLMGKVDAGFWRVLFLDSMGRLWIGTYGMGLYCYDATRVQIFQTGQGLPANPVNCLVEDAEGILWIGTRKGLVGYDGCSFSLLEGMEKFDEKEVTALLVDRSKSLWLGKRNGYLYVRYEGLVQEISEEEGYSINSLLEDQGGRVWFGFRYGRGFGYYEAGKVNYFRPGKGADYPSWIGAMEVDHKGNVWLGSASPAAWDGLCRYDGVSFHRIEGLSGCPILALCEDSDGRLWIGTSEGVSCYDGEHFVTFTREDGLSCEIVTSLVEAEDGIVWIGTEGGGVCCYDGQVIQVIQFPGEPGFNVISDITKAA